MFNHESPLRHEKFISKKIVQAAVNIKHGKQDVLILGDLKSEVDWGYAPDYVDAMQRILNVSKADDFIIATGKKHSVLEFTKSAFHALNMDWAAYAKEDSTLLKKPDYTRIGDSSKLRAITGWAPSITFEEMIGLFVNHEISQVKDER